MCGKHYTCLASACYSAWIQPYRAASMALYSCFTYELQKLRSQCSTNLLPPLLLTLPALFVHNLSSNREAYCSLWKQGCSFPNQTPPIPLTLHIIYPFLPLFSACRLVVFYNKIDEGWRVWFCLVLFGKWHTPGFDREAQQGLTQACLPYKEISAFWPEGSVPIINDLFKHTDWIHCIEAVLSNLLLAYGCFVLWSVWAA